MAFKKANQMRLGGHVIYCWNKDKCRRLSKNIIKDNQHD